MRVAFVCIHLLLVLLQSWQEARAVLYTSPVSIFNLANGSIASVEAINSSSQRFAIQCVAPAVMTTFLLYKEADMRPGVRVAYCSGNDGSHTRRSFTRRDLAICLPALHAPHKRFSSQGWRYVRGWIERFVAYYAASGVSHFYMYTTDRTPPPDMSAAAAAAGITYIDISWALSFSKTSMQRVGKKSSGAMATHGLWYSGQVWAMNDCLYRNKRQQTLDSSSGRERYVFFTDYDEIFDSIYTSVNFKSFLFSSEYIRALTNSRPVDFDSLTFGQYVSYSSACAIDSGSREDWAMRLACTRTTSGRPECIRSGMQKNRSAEVEAWYNCGTWRGRRKHVDNVRTVFLTTVHTVKECPFHRLNCAVYSVDARVGWLNHYRSSVFNESHEQCICGE